MTRGRTWLGLLVAVLTAIVIWCDRGARRIVVGSGGELYWTEDHYASFERIVT